MKWWPAPLKKGDMIRVRVGSIWHYGIYVSDGEVIQFGLPPREGFLPPEDVRVCASGIDEFAGDSIVETARWELSEKLKNHSPGKVVSIARARIGEGGYNLLHNNCEHFAYECVTGVRKCEQEEKVRRQWKERPLLKLCLMKIPEKEQMPSLYPRERMEDIERVSHSGLRRQKYWVWKALEKAVELGFGWKMEELSFKKQRNGKWLCDQLYFSLTHTENWVCAAVSTKPVGVDMEPLSAARNPSWIKMTEKMVRKIATEEEKKVFGLDTPEKLLALWTRKESAFKQSDAVHFKPAQLNVTGENIHTLQVEEHLISICAEHLGCLAMYRMEEDGVHQFTAKEWKP